MLAKSAHTALAVKACLLGGNSNTKCSMTFVNIAVAISALAGGGGLDCSVLCDGCACEEIEQSINETCMHKSKYYAYKCLSYMDENTCVCIDIYT